MLVAGNTSCQTYNEFAAAVELTYNTKPLLKLCAVPQQGAFGN